MCAGLFDLSALRWLFYIRSFQQLTARRRYLNFAVVVSDALVYKAEASGKQLEEQERLRSNNSWHLGHVVLSAKVPYASVSCQRRIAYWARCILGQGQVHSRSNAKRWRQWYSRRQRGICTLMTLPSIWKQASVSYSCIGWLLQAAL